MKRLTSEPIDTAALRSALLRTTDGAVVVFEGIVRDHHEGRAVSHLEYEAYGSMAEREIETILESIHTKYPGVAVEIRHRTGSLRIGEIAVAIVAVASHRAEAFEVCREVIDRVKETVPIWKKEYGPDGERWIGWQGEEAGKTNA